MFRNRGFISPKIEDSFPLDKSLTAKVKYRLGLVASSKSQRLYLIKKAKMKRSQITLHFHGECCHASNLHLVRYPGSPCVHLFMFGPFRNLSFSDIGVIADGRVAVVDHPVVLS
jgi:hypothetical protein